MRDKRYYRQFTDFFLRIFIDKNHNIPYNIKVDADMAQSVEHILGRDGVAGPIPAISSKTNTPSSEGVFVFVCR